jgi:2-polyprenyl-6-methoxyphenol hydroxylase-like FAD-dependent oxidoreductase
MSMTPSPNPVPRRRVAIIGAGRGGLAAALAFHRAGHEVRLFERHEAVKPLGGAVLLSLPVLSVLRDAVFDHTRFLEAMLVENCLKDAETQMETLPISAH